MSNEKGIKREKAFDGVSVVLLLVMAACTLLSIFQMAKLTCTIPTMLAESIEGSQGVLYNQVLTLLPVSEIYIKIMAMTLAVILMSTILISSVRYYVTTEDKDEFKGVLSIAEYADSCWDLDNDTDCISKSVLL